ncbi:aspartate kinase [Marivibrio halodurans]|uniref:aspartate kinase n=1 Tax=Marivibrio halodurans TaxID=2039722 RepID=A0A8J7RYC8_9PROT|nr:aspartate kinase [Marivibrio halodurans]MBP5856997.1 aspartate kinase [Marivibrio halodurans]
MSPENEPDITPEGDGGAPVYQAQASETDVSRQPGADGDESAGTPERGRHTVHKIGGTSMSQVEAVFDNVLIGDRPKDALYNRIFVVSAYGGITDLLLENKKTGEPGVYQLYAGSENDWAWGDALTNVAKRMVEINAEIFEDTADQKSADQFVQDRIEGVRSCLMDLHRLCSFGHFKLEQHLMTVREMLSSLGESHSAYNTALLLRRRGVEGVFVDLSGWREADQSKTLDERIRSAFDDIDLERQLPIVTGYAQVGDGGSDGLMGIYGRGYSEVTFSRIACLTGAKEALIHKEYHLSSGDPKIVGADNVFPIGKTNYDVADQLSNMGMEAIHPRAAKGLRQNGIPLRIVNTFEPDHPGTVIEDDWEPEKAQVEIVTGLETATEIEIVDQDMVGVAGSDEAVSGIFRRFRVPIVAKSSNANTQAYYIAQPMKTVRRIVETLQRHHPDASVRTRKIAFVSVIGANLREQSLLARAVRALDEAGIELMAAHAQGRGVDLQFVLPEGSYAEGVRVLHKTLVEADASTKNGTLVAA